MKSGQITFADGSGATGGAGSSSQASAWGRARCKARAEPGHLQGAGTGQA